MGVLYQYLDNDEFTTIPSVSRHGEAEQEVFVTQPGLNRVMGSDKSRAGRKFQRWLYHEVVPSLTKHGVYPPPNTPQGSALSQMAEIIAQNSRTLADAINRQDQLEREVDTVKGAVSYVSERVSKLENSVRDDDFIITVQEWFNEQNRAIYEDKEVIIVAWCENLSFRKGEKSIRCPSGNRLNTRFSQGIIKEAVSLVERAQG